MYEGFPIYDFKSGLILNKQPWLIPTDAFKNIKNAFIYQGVLQKRKGYTEWGRFVHFVNNESMGTTVDLQLTYSGTVAHYPIRPGNFIVQDTVNELPFTDNGNGTLTRASDSGTINYTTGAWSITYGSNPGAGKSIWVDYNYFPNLPIMGIHTYYQDVGTSQFLVFNTKRVKVF